MFTQVTVSQHWLGNSRLSHSQDRLQNHGAATLSFNRAKKHGVWRRLLAWLTRRSVQLQHYHTTGRQHVKPVVRGVQYIALDKIIGSEGRSHDFDNQFWPITEHIRDRWVNIAIAMGTGKPLPPVQLLQIAGGYVVRDGHHRLSVARAFGRAVIEAEIV